MSTGRLNRSCSAFSTGWARSSSLCNFGTTWELSFQAIGKNMWNALLDCVKNTLISFLLLRDTCTIKRGFYLLSRRLHRSPVESVTSRALMVRIHLDSGTYLIKQSTFPYKASRAMLLALPWWTLSANSYDAITSL